MSKVFIEETTLTNIGSAIREKTGKSDLIAPGDMPAEIRSIVSGGGGSDIDWPAELVVGSANHMETWEWILDDMPPTIIKCASGANGLFNGCSTTEDLSKFTVTTTALATIFQQLFSGCKQLKSLPEVRFTSKTLSNFNSTFANCNMLREIPYDYYYLKDITTGEISGGLGFNDYPYKQSTYSNCYSLRRFPEWVKTPQTATSLNGRLYSTYNNCYVADEVVDVIVFTASITSNFYQTKCFDGLSRAKRITFMTDNGTPYAGANQKQAIDLSVYVGYAEKAGNILDYNSGIGADKQVTDAASYQALKNDPDWWTTDVNYSRYNHDSALETINTLPDVSTGSNNTIKFLGASGALTDGGAINTLTEEEIAVAAAKGWTVTFV